MVRRASKQQWARLFLCVGLGILLSASLSLVVNSRPPQAHAATADTMINPGDGSWVNIAPMLNKRLYAADSLLPNGKVLMVGGYNYQVGNLLSAEMYDPTTNTWTATANMLNTHVGGTATTLPDGRVLVTSGGNNTAEIYDPTTNTWTATGSLTTTASGATAVLLGGNLGVLVVGGGLPTANLYNLSTGTWSATGPFSSLSGASATLLQGPNSRVFVVGGTLADGTPNTTGEIYDPTTNSWSITAAKPYGLATSQTATQLLNGQIAVVNGAIDGDGAFTIMFYDPAHDTWSLGPEEPYAMQRESAVLLRNGKLMILGGEDPAGNPSNAQIYDSTNNTWAFATTAAPGQGYIAAFYAADTAPALLLPNGAVFEAGGIGEDQGVVTNVASIYLPSGSWAIGPAFQEGRHNFAAATTFANGDALVSGGLDDNGDATSSAEIYNHVTGAWTQVASMNYARAGATSILLQNGQVLVFGGGSVTAELYNPTNNTWTITGAPPFSSLAPGEASAALMANGTVVVAAGGNVPMMYSPLRGRWFPFLGANQLSAQAGPTLTTLPDGRILLVSSDGCSIYDPNAFAWTSTSTAPNTGLLANTLDTLLPNGNVLVTGGGLSSASPNQPPEIYNPTTNTWSQTPALPMATTGQFSPISAVLLSTGQVLVLVSGSNNTALYDYATNTWRFGSPLGQAPSFSTALSLGNDQALVNTGSATNSEIFTL